jgi:predicted nuclease of predicted toxin-antitoxin system
VAILLDQNLSPRLVRMLDDVLSGLESVYDHNLVGTSDPVLFDWARHSAVEAIITADRDLVRIVERLGPPPKIIRIDRCDFPSRVVARLLRREAVRIHDFLQSPRGVLQLSL